MTSMYFTRWEEHRGMHTQQAARFEPVCPEGISAMKHRTINSISTLGSPPRPTTPSPPPSRRCRLHPAALGKPGSRAQTMGTQQRQLPLFPTQILPPIVVTSSSEAKPNY